MKKPNTILALTLFIIFVSFSLSLNSCSKEDSPETQQTEKVTTVYGVGSLNATSSSRSIAQYWENGTPTNLTNGVFDAIAESIVVTENDDKHIVGYEKNANDDIVAKYWKNGVVTSLPATIVGEDSVADDIAVVGNDVYISGNEDFGNGNSIAIYWKNNNKEYLSSSTNDTHTTAITVANNKVYVTGYELNGTIRTPVIWINGVVTNLTLGINDAYASDIIVVGTKIYISGSEKNSGNQFAVYWVKDTAVSNSSFVGRVLPTSRIYGGAQSITSIETDVYISGFEGGGTKYWKVDASGNKVATTLTNSGADSDANSIFAFENNIYTLTFEDAVGFKYWKNGTQITTIPTANTSRIYGLFVTSK